MTSKTDIGRKGEVIAIKYLKKNKHKILSTNFRCRYGEIDIITYKDCCIYFYEVKYRNSYKHAYGEEFINTSKIKKLSRSVDYWISKNQNKHKFKEVLLNGVVIDSTGIKEYEIL